VLSNRILQRRNKRLLLVDWLVGCAKNENELSFMVSKRMRFREQEEEAES